MKVISFQVEVNGVQVAVKNQDDLTAAVKETTKAYKSADFGSEEFKQSEKELAKLRTLQGKFRQDVKDTAREQTIAADKGKGSYRALNAELVNLRRRYKELSAADRDAFGPDLLNRIQKLDTELKDIDSSMGQYQRNVGNYADAFASLGGLDLASLATAPGAILAIGAAAIEAGQYIFQVTEEFRKLRGEVQNLTGATDDELDQFTARVASIAETFEQSQEEVLNAANAVSKQLDIPFSEAFDKIEEGFIAGSNQTGEFLDGLREYPTFFKEAGLSADTLFNIINRQASEGLYSDKGVDAIKEGTIRLRENAQTAQDALKGIGLSSEAVQKQIEEEGIGAAIETVTKRLSELRADSPEVATAVADIFGGAGEDAGIAFLTSLQNVTSETGSLIDVTNEYQVQQQRALEVNREFAEIQNEVAKELGGAGAEFSNLGTIIETKALRFLLLFVEQIKVLGSVFSPLIDAFVPLLKSLGLFNEEAGTAENVARLLAKGFEIVATPVRIAVDVIAKFVTGLSDAIDTGRGFLEWLGIVDKEARKAGGGINTLPGAMDGFGKKTKEATEEAEKQDEVIKNNIVTIDSLKEKLKELKEQRDSTRLGSDEFKRLDREILVLEKTLAKYGSASKRASVATDQFAKGSIGALRKQISDLKKELEKATPEDAEGVFEKLVDAEVALKNVEDFRTELRNKLTSTRRDFAPLENLLNADQLVEEGLGDQVRDIGVKQGEAYAEGFEETSSKIEERNKTRADKLLEDQKALAEGIRDIQNEIFQGIGDVLSNVSEASQIRTDNEITRLEERYGREIELAEGNETEQERLEEELATKKAAIQQKELQDQKKYRRAAALSSLASGIINILSAPTTLLDPFGAIYKGVQIGVLTATTTQQIANINAQTAARGAMIHAANGAILPSLGVMGGASHADPSGGTLYSINGQSVMAERGEFFDIDGTGAGFIVNKRSTARHRAALERNKGRIYPGKRQFLSSVNSDRNYGIKLAAEGAVLQPEVASVLSRNTGGSQIGVGSLEISEASINQIAIRVAAATRAGSREGVSEGMGQENKRAIRENRLSRRTGI